MGPFVHPLLESEKKMKRPLIIFLFTLLLTPAYGSDYFVLSNEQLEAKCHEKDSKACLALGEKFQEGSSTKKSPEDANKYFQNA